MGFKYQIQMTFLLCIFSSLLHVSVEKPITTNSSAQLLSSSDDQLLFDFDALWNASYTSANHSYLWFEDQQSAPSECIQFLDDVDDDGQWMDDANMLEDEMDIMDLPSPNDQDVHFLSGVIEEKLWPDATIPTEIDEIWQSNISLRRLACAVEFIHTHSCIRFVKYNPTRHGKGNYLSITMNDYGCRSQYLGMGPGRGRQIVNLQWSSTKCWRHGTIVHELMHVIGFFHEQSREGRDNYVQVNWQNIPEVYKNQYKKASTLNFHQQLIGEYDYKSVMHYSRFRNGQLMEPAISAVNDENNVMGNRKYPTKEDARKINLLYGCGSTDLVETDSNDTKILIIGGVDEKAASSIELYHPFNQHLNHVNNVTMRQGRWVHTSALMDDGTVITVGGWGDGNFSTCSRFTPSTFTVTQCPSLNTRRSHPASSVLNGVLCVCGGRNGRNLLKSCERLLSNGWQDSVSMNNARSGLSMVSLNGYLYAIGGWNGNRLSSVERLGVTDSHWTFVQSMKYTRRRHSTAVMDGKIFVCGSGKAAFSSCEQYNPSYDQWTEIAPMNMKRFGFQLVSDGKNLFAVGGWVGGTSHTVEMYNSNNNTWTMMKNKLIHKRRYHSAVVIP